ncbi:MAG: hypothetical protein R2798_12740 [Chitinophagales bacterium]
MMKNLFYSLLLIAVPFILQAQSYGFYTTEAAHQYNLYIDNNYEGGTGYAAGYTIPRVMPIHNMAYIRPYGTMVQG